jgi:hypothetical protein
MRKCILEVFLMKNGNLRAENLKNLRYENQENICILAIFLVLLVDG